MIVERIEYIVNTTTRFIVDLWVRQWPLLLLTLWAVQDVWLSLELTDTADVVTNTAIAITSFAGTVACLKIFRFERSFWMYAQVFIGVGATFFFTNVELTQLTSILHQDSFDEIWVYRIVEAALWAGVVALLSAGLYFLRFRHRDSPSILIKIPLTTFVMCLFLQPISMFIWFDLMMLAYGIMGIRL